MEKLGPALGVRPRNTGSEPLRRLILFNAPTYEEILLTSWLTTNPPQLVADHFGLDLEVAKIPKQRAGILVKDG